MNKKDLELLEKLSFEKALQELEEIVSQMERGELLLDDMMNAYEKGQILSTICSKKLKSVEKKVEILKVKVNGEGSWEDFNPNKTQTRSVQSSPAPVAKPAPIRTPAPPIEESNDEEFLF